MENIYKDSIVITDRKLASGDFMHQIRKAVSCGPMALILREKDLGDKEYEILAADVSDICNERGVRFYIHSRSHIAKRLGIRNIHLSIPVLSELCSSIYGYGDILMQDKVYASVFRSLRSDFDHISVSCHSEADVESAQKCGATEIILGTIFETECKAGLPGKGLDFVKKISSMTDLPVYAIGGIKPRNLKKVMDAGAAGGCMMSEFMKM